MKQSVLGLMLALAPLAALGSDTKGVTIEKSFLQSVYDCAEYLQVPTQRLVQYLAYEFPPDQETKCLIYCVGTDLRWWNSTCDLRVPAIVNFFQPVQGDRQYEKRTNECLKRNVNSLGASLTSCCRAYEIFQCYFQEFGNLVTCPQYVPATKLQATQAALDCINMLRVPAELLQCYSNGDLPDVRETWCLYHCIDLRTGLYTPDNGVQLPRFYVRDMLHNDLRYLSKETKACRDRVRHSGCDACLEVYTTHQDCLVGLGEEGYTRTLITEAARMALGKLAPCCGRMEHLPEKPTPEVGYSYASYQPMTSSPCESCGAVNLAVLPSITPTPSMARSPCKSCGALNLALLPSKAPTMSAINVPVYAPRKSCTSCGSKPKSVPYTGRFPTAPFVKHVQHAASGRPQLVYYPVSKAPGVEDSCITSALAGKPAFSVFSTRSFPERSGPYPSSRSCRSEPFDDHSVESE